MYFEEDRRQNDSSCSSSVLMRDTSRKKDNMQFIFYFHVNGQCNPTKDKDKFIKTFLFTVNGIGNLQKNLHYIYMVLI